MTDFAPAGDVALLALLYRELNKAHYTSPHGLFDDIECCPGELCLLLEVGSQSMTAVDWAVVQSFDHDVDGFADGAIKLLRALGESDPLRAEAMLHAWPPGMTPPYGADYRLAPFGSAERQQAVLAAKREVEARGFTTNFDDVRAVAEEVNTEYEKALAIVEAGYESPPEVRTLSKSS